MEDVPPSHHRPPLRTALPQKDAYPGGMNCLHSNCRTWSGILSNFRVHLGVNLPVAQVMLLAAIPVRGSPFMPHALCAS